MLKEIYHLLLPSERRMGMRVIMAVFFSALLNFAGLAALIPVLLFLIEEKEEKGEALLFCLLALFYSKMYWSWDCPVFKTIFYCLCIND